MPQTHLESGSRYGVIGYGSWATTLVGQLAGKGIHVNWYIRNPEVLECVREEGYNPKYVRDLELDTSMLNPVSDINEVVSGSDILILAVPSAYLADALSLITVGLEGKFVVSAVKGIIPGRYVTVLEYVHEVFGLPFSQMGVISGPTHAEEVSRGNLSYITVACTSEENAGFIAGSFRSSHLNVNITKDIYGVEYAAVLKNVYAIASGIASGLGYGDNFLAVLVSRCAAEMVHFLTVGHPCDRNPADRAYLGDLLVTCYSNYSRNRRLGQFIGRGFSVKSALNEMTMVAEGYFGAECIHHLCAASGIELPIAETVYNILYCKAKPRKAMAELAGRL